VKPQPPWSVHNASSPGNLRLDEGESLERKIAGPIRFQSQLSELVESPIIPIIRRLGVLPNCVKGETI
jgi:hypothetical protein